MVTIVAADSSLGGTVYALPAGVSGASEESEVPHAAVEDGRALLPVPGPGPWDVGWISAAGGLSAISTDRMVRGGATSAVNIVVPDGAPIEVRFADADAQAYASGRQAHATLQPTEASSSARFPGRGQEPPCQFNATFNDEGIALFPVVPRGRAFDLKLHYGFAPGDPQPWIDPSGPLGRILVPDRSTVRAGDRVDVRLSDRMRLAWAVEIPGEPPEGHADRGMTVFVRIRVDGWVGGDYVSLASRSERVAFPPRGLAQVSWSGRGVFPGELIDVPITGNAPLVIRMQRDTEWVPLRSARIPFRAIGVEDGRDCFVFRPRDGREFQLEDAQGDSEAACFLSDTEGDLAPGDLLVAFAGTRVSAPTAVPLYGVMEVRLAPGGFLMVTSDRWFAPGLGSLTLRAADGSGIPLAEWSEYDAVPYGAFATSRPSVVPGTLLGPLPAGSYRFEVGLGGARLSDAVGSVRVGRIEALQIVK